jgi:hypothetical protein
MVLEFSPRKLPVIRGSLGSTPAVRRIPAAVGHLETFIRLECLRYRVGRILTSVIRIRVYFMNDISGLAAIWIRFQRSPKGSVEYEELFWVVDRMMELCDSEPSAAWNVIQEAVALDQSDEILGMVGAGPFEDLMTNHGAFLIDKVESCARTNPAFRRMLGVVWKSTITDDVWIRLKALAPASW